MTQVTTYRLAAAGALLIALTAAYFWGASGKGDLARAVQAAELRGTLLESRAAVLDARVEIYNINFGEASRHLEDARVALGRASQELRAVTREEDAKRLDSAIATIDDAQRLARQLNQDANSRAADVANVIAAVLAPQGTR